MNSVNASPNPDLLLSLLTGMVGNSSASTGLDGQLLGFASFLDSSDVSGNQLSQPLLEEAPPLLEEAPPLLEEAPQAKEVGAELSGGLNALISAAMLGMPAQNNLPVEAPAAGSGLPADRLQQADMLGQAVQSGQKRALNRASEYLARSPQAGKVGQGEIGQLPDTAIGSIETTPGALSELTGGGTADSLVSGTQKDGNGIAAVEGKTLRSSGGAVRGAEEPVGTRAGTAIASPSLKSKSLPDPLAGATNEATLDQVEGPAGATPSNSGQSLAANSVVDGSAGTAHPSPRGSNHRTVRGADSRSESAGPFGEAGIAGFNERSAVDYVTASASSGRLPQDVQSSKFGGELELNESPAPRGIDSERASPNLSSAWEMNTDSAVEESRFEQALEQAAEVFPLESVAQQIASSVEPDSGWISIEIQPPELGKLEIMVSKQGDDYLARIVAHEAATSEALNLQQAELIEALSQHGLELKEVQITTDSNSGNSWNQDSSSQDQTRQEQQHTNRSRESFGDQSQQGQSGQALARSGLTNRSLGNEQVNILV
jgi:hypothetical protein